MMSLVMFWKQIRRNVKWKGNLMRYGISGRLFMLIQ
jgi:hypothetical protein